MAVFILIVVAGAVGTFIGILTVMAKNERTTNRNQLLSNIGGSIALASIVCLVPGGIVYVFTDDVRHRNRRPALGLSRRLGDRRA